MTPEERARAVVTAWHKGPYSLHTDTSEMEKEIADVAFTIQSALNEARLYQRHLTPELMARAIVSEPDWWRPGPEFLIDFDRLREHIARAIAFDRGYRK